MGTCLQLFLFLQKEQTRLLEEQKDWKKCRYLQIRLTKLMEKAPESRNKINQENTKKQALLFYSADKFLIFSLESRSDSSTKLVNPLHCKLYQKNRSLYIDYFEKDQNQASLTELLFENLESLEFSFYDDESNKDKSFVSSWPQEKRKIPQYLICKLEYINHQKQRAYYHFTCPLRHSQKYQIKRNAQ